MAAALSGRGLVIAAKAEQNSVLRALLGSEEYLIAPQVFSNSIECKYIVCVGREACKIFNLPPDKFAFEFNIDGKRVVVCPSTTLVQKRFILYPLALRAFEKARGSDILKSFPEFVPTPSLKYIEWWISNLGDNPIACDIETIPKFRAITMIGFAGDHGIMSVPLIRDYWSNTFEEFKAIRLCEKILNTPNTKIFQNCVYDLMWLRKIYGFRVRGKVFDIMAHHCASYPQLPHDLETIGALYMNYPAWK
jgi:hypothetical protein